MVLSPLALATVVPSEEKVTELIESHNNLECPVRVLSTLPDATSHSLMVLSPLALARILPSGEKATDSTELEWPLKLVISL